MATSYIAGSKRFCRQYAASNASATYAALTSAVEAARVLKKTPWVPVEADLSTTFPPHAELGTLPASVNYYDAYEFCAEHADGQHRAYAGMVAHRIELPSAAVGLTLTSVSFSVSCDPYNPAGARLALTTTSVTDSYPSPDWQTAREGVCHLDAFAPRTANTDGSLWYGTTATATLSPAGGLVLGRYIWIYLSLENYERARNGWLEGAARIHPVFSITVASSIPGYFSGDNIAGGYTDPSLQVSTADESVVLPCHSDYGVGADRQKFRELYFSTTRVVSASTAAMKRQLYAGASNFYLSVSGTSSYTGNYTVSDAYLPASIENRLLQLAVSYWNGTNTPANSGTRGWKTSQYGLVANVRHYAAVSNPALSERLISRLSIYVVPVHPSGSFTGTKLILKNGSASLSMNGAAVTITPWWIPGISALTSSDYALYASTALCTKSAFWTGSSTSVSGSVTSVDTYTVMAQRVADPMIIPDAVAASQELVFSLQNPITEFGTLILVPWVSDVGGNLSSPGAVVGLAPDFQIPSIEAASVGNNLGWFPEITFK